MKQSKALNLIILTAAVLLVLSAHGVHAQVARNGTDGCPGTPIRIPADLDYTFVGVDTCAMTDDWNTFRENGICDLSYRDQGPDIVYQLAVSTKTCIDINYIPDGLHYPGIAVSRACPATIEGIINPACLGSDGGGASGQTATINFLTLEAGNYSLFIDNWPAPDCTTGTLQVTECGTHECETAIPIEPGRCIVVDNTGQDDSVTAVPTCGGYQGGDIWLKVRVPEGQMLKSAWGQPLEGSKINDTGLAIYKQCPPMPAGEIVSNDDGGVGAFPALSGGFIGPRTFLLRTWEFGNNRFGKWVVCVGELSPAPVLREEPKGQD
ncbi:MAG: hypothetical protein GY842_07445 [bacterium]|nr:hypothetical protein [bacterium]